MPWRERPRSYVRGNAIALEDWCERAEAAIEAAQKALEDVRASAYVEEARLHAGIGIDAIRLLGEDELDGSPEKLAALAIADRAAMGLRRTPPPPPPPGTVVKGI